MSEIFGSDAYTRQQMAERVQAVGMCKAQLPLLTRWLLGVLAGAFIGLGALMATLVVSNATLSFAVQRLLGGLAFSLGLLMVAVAIVFPVTAFAAACFEHSIVNLHRLLKGLLPCRKTP